MRAKQVACEKMGANGYRSGIGFWIGYSYRNTYVEALEMADT